MCCGFRNSTFWKVWQKRFYTHLSADISPPMFQTLLFRVKVNKTSSKHLSSSCCFHLFITKVLQTLRKVPNFWELLTLVFSSSSQVSWSAQASNPPFCSLLCPPVCSWYTSITSSCSISRALGVSSSLILRPSNRNLWRAEIDKM